MSGRGRRRSVATFRLQARVRTMKSTPWCLALVWLLVGSSGGGVWGQTEGGGKGEGEGKGESQGETEEKARTPPNGRANSWTPLP